MISIYCLLQLSLICILIIQSSEAQRTISTTAFTIYTSTASDVLLQALQLSYSIQESNVKISRINALAGFASGKLALFNRDGDLALTSETLTPIEQLNHPSIVQLPYTSVPIVPIFNLGDISQRLILSRQTLALIFNRSIISWNDPLIIRDNNLTGRLTIDLPDRLIVVILPPVTRSTSTIFNNALQTLYPLVNQSINRYDSSASYAADTASTTLANLYSISFSTYQDAVRAGVSMISILSLSSTVVSVSKTSVEQAVNAAASVRAQQIVDPTTSQAITLDLSAAPGTSSWPIMGTGYLMIDSAQSRSTCTSRAAVVKFALWLYSSSTAAAIMRQTQLEPLPLIVASTLDVVFRLRERVLCRGAPAAPAQSVNGIVVSGDPRINTISSLLLIGYNDRLSTADSLLYEYHWTPNKGELAVQQIVSDEASLAMVFSDSIPVDQWQRDVITSPTAWAIPMFLSSTEMVFNLQISPTVRLPHGTTLSLPIDMIAAVMLGNIYDWRSPVILAYNPLLAAALAADTTNTSAPITMITACDAFAQGGVGTFFAKVLMHWIPALRDLIRSLAIIPDICLVNLYDAPNSTVLHVASEIMSSSAVAATVGSFSYRSYGEDEFSNLGTMGIVHKGRTIVPSADSMLACVSDTLDPNTLEAPVFLSEDPDCYILTQTVYGVMMNDFSALQSGPGSCVSGQLTNAYAGYIYNSTTNDPALRAAGVVRVGENESVRQIIDASLVSQGLTCDGVSLLAAPDVVYTVSSGLYGIAITMTVIGLVATWLGVCALMLYKRHPSVVTAKLSFSLVSGLGVAMFFGSLLTLVSPATETSCAALVWMVNLGCTMVYAPVLLKTFRVYKMHGGGRIISKVDRWSSERLVRTLGAIIAVDLAFLIAWQGAAPFTAMNTYRIEGDNDVTHVYTMCGQPSEGLPFLLISSIVKAFCLLFGAMMAFAVKSISTAFNELKHNTILIYCSSIGTGLFLTVGITQIGDARIALFVIGMLWNSVVAYVVLFVPKFIAIRTPKHQLNQQTNVATGRTDEVLSESLGFGFDNVNGMSEDVLTAYVNSLTTHIAQIRAQLKLDEPPHDEVHPTKQNGGLKKAASSNAS